MPESVPTKCDTLWALNAEAFRLRPQSAKCRSLQNLALCAGAISSRKRLAGLFKSTVWADYETPILIASRLAFRFVNAATLHHPACQRAIERANCRGKAGTGGSCAHYAGH